MAQDSPMAQDSTKPRRKRRQEVVFSVHIEYNYEARKQGLCFTGSVENSNTDSRTFEKSIEDIIQIQLPREMDRFFGIQVKTSVTGLTVGSLTLFFTAIFGTYNSVANYKNFVEGAHLMRRHTERLISAHIRRKWDDRLETSVSMEYPPVKDKELRERPVLDYCPNWCNRVLVVSALLNLAFLTIIGALVYAAVMKVYFP